MRQKYLISIIPETKELFIREFAEVEKGEFAFVCEEIHDEAVIRDAMAGGVSHLVPLVRRPNMYPRQEFGEKIARGIIDLLSDGSGGGSREILIDDMEAFKPSEDDLSPEVLLEEDSDGDGDQESEEIAAGGDKTGE